MLKHFYFSSCRKLVCHTRPHSYIFVLQGEMSFEEDCLVEGGCKSLMHNGTGYREVRQYQSDHHLVRFYFVTCIYSSYMKSILEDFRNGLKPDVLIVNSCVWDISRWVGEGVCSNHHSTFFSHLD